MHIATSWSCDRLLKRIIVPCTLIKNTQPIVKIKVDFMQTYCPITYIINIRNNNNKECYERECVLDIHLSPIRPTTQHRLTTIIT